MAIDQALVPQPGERFPDGDTVAQDPVALDGVTDPARPAPRGRASLDVALSTAPDHVITEALLSVGAAPRPPKRPATWGSWPWPRRPRDTSWGAAEPRALDAAASQLVATVTLLRQHGLRALVATMLLVAPAVALGLGVLAAARLASGATASGATAATLLVLASLAGLALFCLAPGLLALGPFATFGTALRAEAPGLRPLLSIAVRRLPALAVLQLLPGVMLATAMTLASSLRGGAWTPPTIGAVAGGAYGACLALATWRVCSLASAVVFMRPWRDRADYYQTMGVLLRRADWPWLALSGTAPLAIYAAAFFGPLTGRDWLVTSFGGPTADLVLIATRLTGLALGVLVDAAATAAFVRTRSDP